MQWDGIEVNTIESMMGVRWDCLPSLSTHRRSKEENTQVENLQEDASVVEWSGLVAVLGIEPQVSLMQGQTETNMEVSKVLNGELIQNIADGNVALPINI